MKRAIMHIAAIVFSLTTISLYAAGTEEIPLGGLTVPEAFQRLEKPEIMADDALLDTKIEEAFYGRQTEAIRFAINSLRSPRIQNIDGNRVDRTFDLRAAKRIFQKFPADALDLLKKEYLTGNATLRENIIQAVGGMAAEDEVRPMLIAALDDKAFSDEEDPEMEGDPLRVCDNAYNQLVLRYSIKDVLRTIGAAHRIEIRDYHIEILKEKFLSGAVS
ncbi:MAG: hypothetical protein PHE18_06200 [Candidatus Omnitrophica bacterium]|nr:hypothetical protein [Candidatus Omnitrophota bacterium]MDD5553448.1 hypothetical protein [Candidatus Omnitrophota bacterium]